jgi:hypothetical protein
MGQTGEITQGLRLVSSGLRRLMAHSMALGLSEALRIGSTLRGYLEQMSRTWSVTDQELVEELAKVLTDPDAARLVARRAGFGAGQLPAFNLPIAYWSTVVEAAGHGAIEGGVLAVAEAAAQLFPGNSRFKRYLSSPR